MAVITTGLSERELFLLFLRRGFAVDRKAYFSILKWELKTTETSLKFFCRDHCKVARPKNVDESLMLGAIPEFTVYLVGNQVFVQDRFVGRERQFLKARGESPEICGLIMHWLSDDMHEPMHTIRQDDGSIRIVRNDRQIKRKKVASVHREPIANEQSIARHTAELKKRNQKKHSDFLAWKESILPHIAKAMKTEPV